MLVQNGHIVLHREYPTSRLHADKRIIMSTRMGDSIHCVKQRGYHAGIFSLVYNLVSIKLFNIVPDKTNLLAGCMVKIGITEVLREVVVLR